MSFICKNFREKFTKQTFIYIFETLRLPIYYPTNVKKLNDIMLILTLMIREEVLVIVRDLADI